MTHAEQEFTPEAFRAGINQWPPFSGQRVSVTAIADDWTSVDVRMELQPDNANFFGTAWGGTLFSMLDPFLPILIERQLGEHESGVRYAVWDKSAEIDFVRPGTTAIHARVDVPAEVIEEIRTETNDGDKHLRWFEIPLLDEADQVVAVQRRQIYVRLQRPASRGDR
jgi:acyl-coenzyme A thioesterase PaaI-like protein